MRRLQTLQAAATLPAFGIAFAALAAAASRFSLGASSSNNLRVLGLDMTYPAANLAALLLLGMALLGVWVLIRAIRLALFEVAAQRRFVRALSVVGRVLGHEEVRVFDDARPQAFCAGLLRPRAYISSAALELLGAPELEAVVAHELQHRRSRDPLRLLVAGVAARALFELPPYRLIAERLGTVAELVADRAAVEARNGDRRPLASALLSMAQAEHGTVGIDPERVDALTGRQRDWRLPRAWALALSSTLAVLAVVLWQTIRTAHFETSLALPGLSSKPCVLVLAVLPAAAALLVRKVP